MQLHKRQNIAPILNVSYLPMRQIDINETKRQKIALKKFFTCGVIDGLFGGFDGFYGGFVVGGSHGVHK